MPCSCKNLVSSGMGCPLTTETQIIIYTIGHAENDGFVDRWLHITTVLPIVIRRAEQRQHLIVYTTDLWLLEIAPIGPVKRASEERAVADLGTGDKEQRLSHPVPIGHGDEHQQR